MLISLGCSKGGTVTGTVRDANGAVHEYRVAWKPGLLTDGMTHGSFDKWETGYFERGTPVKEGGEPVTFIHAHSPNGAFELTDLPVGHLTLFLSREGTAWGAYEVRDLKNGEERVVDIMLESLENIEERSNKPILNCAQTGDTLICRVSGLLRDEEPDIYLYKDMNQPGRWGVKGPGGDISIDLKGLEPGEYTVDLIAARSDRPGGRQTRQTFTYTRTTETNGKKE